MTQMNWFRWFAAVILTLTTWQLHAEDVEKECSYEVKLWGKLQSGHAGVISQDNLRVSVVGEVRSGKDVWYNVVRRPGDAPELVPQGALEAPYPSGTCMGVLASLKDSVDEAWSQYTSDMIHEDDIEIPVPAKSQPVPLKNSAPSAREAIAFSREASEGTR